ncbi:MAG TPA: hypothetical protein VK564_00455 [Thermodesulfobacteriota bacterium]|nr:hypothetical protein [Thermodesulfobacteriota bacterium]
METGLLAYFYAFKHVPLWWWFIGLLLVAANVIILHPKAWKRLTDNGWKSRLNGFYTRSFREYTGSTNGWIKNEGSLS